ncbi:MAG: O-antigen ligase family protein [Rhizobiaceae bacterium]
MTAAARETDKYLLGIVIFLAMCIGGGTRSGLMTDFILEAVTILVCSRILAKPGAVPVSGTAAVLISAALAAMILQLVPLPSGLLVWARNPPVTEAMERSGSPIAFMTLGFSYTLRSLLVFLSLSLFFLAVSRLRSDQVVGLAPFFLVGVLCNILAGAIQFSSADQVVIDDLLPYRITAGFFANINHFSSLLFVTIPFLVYYGVIRGNMKVAACGMVVVMLMLLAAGSRAGIGIGFGIMVASIVLLSSRSRFGIGALLVLFAALSIYSMGAWTRFEADKTNSNSLRLEFIETTWDGIKDNWLTGTGYGNFEQAYPIYEKPEHIFRYFVNHAHNEYVQLVFEGGILAALLIAAYLVLLHVQFWRVRADAFRKVAYLGTLFLLLHSLVDYPLRTFALLVPFVFFNAILFYSGTFPKKQVQARIGDIEIDDGSNLVPADRTPQKTHRRDLLMRPQR